MLATVVGIAIVRIAQIVINRWYILRKEVAMKQIRGIKNNALHGMPREAGLFVLISVESQRSS